MSNGKNVLILSSYTGYHFEPSCIVLSSTISPAIEAAIEGIDEEEKTVVILPLKNTVIIRSC